MVAPQIQLIHLQLTKHCNLRCSFCGQWGDAGYMKGSTVNDLTIEDWLRVVDQAVDYRSKTGVNPMFILWGGEPLASPAFPAVSTALRDHGFKTQLITNGVLIEKHSELINRNIDTVFVSLDGPPEIHEKLRGASGIYPKIKRGMATLDPKRVKRICLFTLCGDNYHVAAEFPHQLEAMGFEQVIYQNLIFCNSEQAADYRHWMKTSFGQEAPKLSSWISDTVEPWVEQLNEVRKTLQTEAQAGRYPIEVELYPNDLNTSNIAQWYNASIPLKKNPSPCLLPFRHLQVNHDGNTHFCVDFNDFSLGNVRESTLFELFHNERAARFRAEGATCNSLCARCPWYYNQSLAVDQGTIPNAINSVSA